MSYAISSGSFEGRLLNRLDRWQMSIDTCALLAALEGIRIGKTRLAGALNGKDRALPVDTALAMEPFLAEVDELVRSVSPLVLDLNNPQRVYGWLLTRRAGKLKIEVTQ